MLTCGFCCCFCACVDLSSSHEPAGFSSRLQRQSRIIHRGILRRQVSYCCHDPASSRTPLLRKLQTTPAPRKCRSSLIRQGHVTEADELNQPPGYLDEVDLDLLRERTDSILHSTSESEYSDGEFGSVLRDGTIHWDSDGPVSSCHITVKPLI